jgi:hypothetical protein
MTNSVIEAQIHPSVVILALSASLFLVGRGASFCQGRKTETSGKIPVPEENGIGHRNTAPRVSDS